MKILKSAGQRKKKLSKIMITSTLDLQTGLLFSVAHNHLISTLYRAVRWIIYILVNLDKAARWIIYILVNLYRTVRWIIYILVNLDTDKQNMPE